MLAFDKALKIVLDSARRLGTERVTLAEAAGRVLAEDVTCDIDMPPFDKSLRDGYACRRADLRNELSVIETIAAGQKPRISVGKNQCAKIMTGAKLPEGTDCVVMVEYVEKRGGMVRFQGNDTADNISRQGEDIRAGDIIVGNGERIGPAQIGTLASVGWVKPLVSLRPRVGVIVTGDELVAAGQKPEGSQIRDSNGPQLAAQLRQFAGISRDYGVVRDVEEDISTAVTEAAAENDVVLICGGVSAGDYDYVPGVLRQNGFELLFEKIAVKPGKPTVFGVRDDTYVFGLPGNPVSVLVIFEILVKPFLYKLMGHDYKARSSRGRMGETLKRKETDRLEWVPVLTGDDGTVRLVEYHGSGHISALCRAEGLAAVDIGAAEIPKGAVVEMRLL